MSIKKEYYNNKIEGKLVLWHIIINILNLLLHLITIGFVLNLDTTYKVTNLTSNTLIVWSSLLSLYLTFTLARLVYYTRQKSLNAYNAHRFTFFTRAAVLYLSIARFLYVNNTKDP